MTLIRNIHRGSPGPKKARARTGFTLVEIAVVLVIISALLTMGMAALNAQITNSAVSATKKKQSVIQDALTTYLGLHGQLPCPDTDANPPSAAPAPDGIENRTNGGTQAVPPDPTQACLLNYGIVPYVTLGLPQDMALDGWDNYFSYYVSNVPANSSSDWTLTTSFHTGNLGAFNVYSNTGNINFLANASPLVRTGAVVLVVSHGKNGLGSITQQGTPNTPATNDEYLNTIACKAAPGSAPLCTGIDFWKRDATDNAVAPGGPFDDIVLFLEPGDLITPLTKDGTLQGPMGTTRQSLQNLSDQLTGAIVSASVTTANGTFPSNANSLAFMTQLNPQFVSSAPFYTYTIPVTSAPADAWGNPITLRFGSAQPGFYLQFGSAISTSCNPLGVAYTLISNRPDGLPGTADDVSYTVSMGTLIRFVTAAGATLPAGNCV